MSFEPFIRLEWRPFLLLLFSLQSACDFVVNMNFLYYKMILKVIFFENGFHYVEDATNSFNEMIREKWAK